MRTILFCLLAFFALRISAFGLAGAYERMWYWSAYQLEQQFVDEADRKIATKCKSCSFAQFITYLEKRAEQPTVKSRFTAYKARNGRDYVPTSVDEGARWLDDNGITKKMELSRVYQEIYDPPNLFRELSRAIGDIYKSKHPDTSKPPFSDAFLARKRVDTIRTAESHLAISRALRSEYDPANKAENNRPVYQGLVRDDNSKRLPNGKVVPDCDLKSAIEAIEREKKVRVSLHDYYKAYRAGTLETSGSDKNAEDNHPANIQQIQNAKRRMLGGLCREDHK